MVNSYINDVIFPGYLYISLDHESGPQDAIASYRPEIQEGIWTGFISMDPLKPSGPEYDAFTQEVIDEFQDPVWDGYPVLPANASTSDVSVYAGRICQRLIVVKLNEGVLELDLKA